MATDTKIPLPQLGDVFPNNLSPDLCFHEAGVTGAEKLSTCLRFWDEPFALIR